jgi:hypothetical protein
VDFVGEHDDAQEEACDERDAKRIRVSKLEHKRHPCPKREYYWRNNLQRYFNQTVMRPGLLQCAGDARGAGAEENDDTNERQLHVGEE